MRAGEETLLEVGEPFVSSLTAVKQGGKFNFSQSVKGRMGERIRITRSGKRPDAPKLRITNEDGSYNKSFQFQYG